MAVKQWGSEKGIRALEDLSQLYLSLVWESTVLLSLCSGEYQPGFKQFARLDLEKLFPPEILQVISNFLFFQIFVLRMAHNLI